MLRIQYGAEQCSLYGRANFSYCIWLMWFKAPTTSINYAVLMQPMDLKLVLEKWKMKRMSFTWKLHTSNKMDLFNQFYSFFQFTFWLGILEFRELSEWFSWMHRRLRRNFVLLILYQISWRKKWFVLGFEFWVNQSASQSVSQRASIVENKEIHTCTVDVLYFLICEPRWLLSIYIYLQLKIVRYIFNPERLGICNFAITQEMRSKYPKGNIPVSLSNSNLSRPGWICNSSASGEPFDLLYDFGTNFFLL